jgi:hypothetical protein
VAPNNSQKTKNNFVSKPSAESIRESKILLNQSLGNVKTALDSLKQRKSTDPIDDLTFAAGEYRHAAVYSRGAGDFEKAIKYANNSAKLYREVGRLSSKEGNDGSVYNREAQESDAIAQESRAYLKKQNPPARRIRMFFSSLLLIIGLFFLSPNITGAVISNLPTQNSNIFGIILLFLGLILLKIKID